MLKKTFLNTFIIVLLTAIFCASAFTQPAETITGQQRDTLLQMAARENPNYDLCIVMDISGSMKGTLEKLKTQASGLTRYANPKDTLIFIKFDDSPRKPLIQEVKDSRDIEMFNSWITKTETTQRFGTDIQAAYYTALKTLNDLNETRKKDGKPLRIQYMVFVSDGDDIPPANSDFRNKASKQSIELVDLIKKSDKEKFIRIIPVGIKFDGYTPRFKRFEPGHVPDNSKINDPEIQKFITQLGKVLNRRPGTGLSGNTEKVPKSQYQFYIDWLSDKVKLTRVSVSKGEEKHSKIHKYMIKSNFNYLDLENLNATAVYKQATGTLEGRITDVRVSSPAIKPGGTSYVEVTVLYPQNWSLKRKKSEGVLQLSVYGDMVIEIEEDDNSGKRPTPSISPTPSPSPSAKPKTKMVKYSYPFNTLEHSEAAVIEIRPEKLLYFIIGLLVLAVIGFPAAFIYQVIVPITVTLKSGDKARAFRLSHKGKITIGGHSDFEITGADDVKAEIQRRFRRFVLVEKEEGIIPASYSPRDGKLPLKLGEGFSLTLAGSYMEFEFLPGDREFADEEEAAGAAEITDEDLDEGFGDFNF